MVQYEVKITEQALKDMESIYEHIACVLLSPGNAIEQYNRIADAILKLDTLPERFKVLDSEPEHSRGIRRMLVDNYSIFYVINKSDVMVINVLYSASDLSQRLR